jgi:HPt (histidine-containing phosphotransfer) domain-containing protein
MATPYILETDELLARLGGDKDIFNIMVDTYLEDVDLNCNALANALADGGAAAIQREAHTVKGLLATVGDNAGSAEAYLVEMRAKNGDIAGVETQILALQARLREVADVLRRETGR